MPGKKVVVRKNKKKAGRAGYAPLTLITSKRTVQFPYPYGNLLSEAAPGAGFVWSYRMNSLFDPDFTGIGLQPLGFDQFSALYGRYAVVSASFEVSFSNTTSLPIRVGYFLSPQSTVPALSGSWNMQPFGASVTMGALGSGKDVIVLRGNTSFYNELGVTKQQYRDEADFSATTSASPLRILYLHTFTHSLTGVSNATCVAYVKIKFNAELSQLVSQNFS